MARRSKIDGAAVALLSVLIALGLYVGFIYHLTTENLAFAIIATAIVTGIVGATIAGRFTRDGSVWTRLSQFVLQNLLVMAGFLGLTSLGLGLGWNTIAERHEIARRTEAAEHAAATERARQEAVRKAEEARRKEDEAKFAAMDADAHLAAARQAMGKSAGTASVDGGGALDEAERHLRAIAADQAQRKSADELAQTVASRRARIVLAEARQVMLTSGDIFERTDKAAQILRRMPVAVPETDEANLIRAQITLQRDHAHLDAARKAIGERAFLLAEAHLDKISPSSPDAPTAKKLLLKSTAERRREAQAAARQQRERERAERVASSAYRGLLCCDGSLSPSCSCGGSHRGCCSHHGGVCGCE